MMPIPKSLLIHGAIHRTGLVEDEWDNPTWTESQTLSYVRFEPSTRLVLSKDNKEVQLAMVMFFDARNSLPAGRTFTVGDEIEFGGDKYHVETIDPVYDRALHHYEIGSSLRWRSG